jgi:hypothetical protein
MEEYYSSWQEYLGIESPQSGEYKKERELLAKWENWYLQAHSEAVEYNRGWVLVPK